MGIKERLLEDMKTAMREKDVIRKEVLQICRAGVLQVEKDSLKTLDEDGVMEVLSKEYRKRTETLSELAQSGREDVLSRIRAEMVILEGYLPKPLTEAEIEQIVREAVAASGATSARDMGKVMPLIMPRVKGKADGRLVNTVVKRVLEG
jgi:uncharacterized protein YqeY